MEWAAVREALERYDWQAAYDLTSWNGDGTGGGEADAPTDAPRLDAHAEAAWWLGRIDECITAREQAYARFDAAGLTRQAGQCAVWLYEHHCFKARPVIGNAWLRRARRALADDPECVEYGNLLLREAEAAHGAGDLDRSSDLASGALALARRLASPDLEAEALQTLGRLLIDRGRPAEGLAHLDEAMLFAIEGRLGPYQTGKVYCSLVSACEELGDPRRAAEWTEATSRWAERHPFAVFPGLCRVHRAVVLQQHGDWEQAEREARRACEELESVNLPNAAAALAEVGDIRRRLGDLDGAELAFARAEQLCCRPSAGLALLRLAQGRLDEARAIVTSALAGEAWNRLARARLLPALVQVAIAAGDLDTAREAVEELDGVVAGHAGPALHAAAAAARGRLQLAEGEPIRACATLRDAVQRWQELDVPYEVATARLLLGRACRETGDEGGAAASLLAAQAIFDRLGARVDARHARELHGRPALPAGLTVREAEVLRLVSSGRTNREIAGELQLSRKTVDRHVANIFVKVGVNSRAAATRFASEHGIVGTGA